MPNFIIATDQPVSKLRNLLKSKKSILDFTPLEHQLLNVALNSRLPGGTIPPEIADIKTHIFTVHNGGTSRQLRVTKDVADRYFSNLENIQKSSRIDWSQYLLGLRLYVGKNASDYNIVAVPTISQKPKQDEIDHNLDLEVKMFQMLGQVFFALNTNTNKIDLSPANCENLIAKIDISGVQLVYLTYDNLKAFKAGLSTPDYDHLSFTFAREDINANSKLSLVLTFLKGNTTVTSNMLIDGQIQKIQGTYFDKSDLIPPPPPTGTNINDSHFNQTM